jgi:RimJ/RimL family protein N-acetyltransferase
MRFPQDVPLLGEGQVTLRAHSADDVDAVTEQGCDPQMAAWTTVPDPYRREDALEWVSTKVPAGWADGSNLGFAIVHDGGFAGSVDLRPRTETEAEVGYALHPAHRRQGVMRAALNLILDWGFDQCGFRVVTWRANVGNWASRRVAWAAGFRFGPTVPQLLLQRGLPRDAWTGWLGADDARRPTCRWLDPPVLETGDLRLRAWREDDADRLVETSEDPRMRHFIPHSPLPHAREEVPAYLLRVRQMASEGTRMPWCVADRDTDEALGNVALFGFGADRSAQVGYWSHPDARGRGVLSRATRTVADWALAPAPRGFGLRRLSLVSAVSNTASRRVAEQSGFVHVGTERSAAPVGGGFDDNAVYDRLAE